MKDYNVPETLSLGRYGEEPTLDARRTLSDEERETMQAEREAAQMQAAEQMSDPAIYERIEEENASYVRRTALIPSPFFSERVGADVYLKMENLQFTGSYKVRGALHAVRNLKGLAAERPLITASAGNHAQGLAFAAQLMGYPANIVMPEPTPLIKINRTKSYGARVLLHGDNFDEAQDFARRLANERGFTFIHPFNDYFVAQGQGTIGVEILQDLPDMDILLLPIGGGGLATGVASYVKAVKPDVRIYAIEPSTCASFSAALEAGEAVCLEEGATIADGVEVREVGHELFPILRETIDGVIRVPDEQLVGAFLDLLENHKVIAENAGVLSLAALDQLVDIDLGLRRGQDAKICCVISGGNMDVVTLSSMVQHGLVARSRVFTFKVLLPDKPGQLQTISEIVARMRGNIIGLEHNPFVSLNRNQAVELTVTLEAFGEDHKNEIMEAVRDFNSSAHEVRPSKRYN